MRKLASLAVVAVLTPTTALAQELNWKPVPGHVATRFAKDVHPDQPWPEYPRPTLVRKEWLNLNGLWDYAIRPAREPQPKSADGRILVPFALESSLSGVGRTLQPEQRLWYRRSFVLPGDPAWNGKRILLHFEAVDWHAEVSVDGHTVGEHRGGYDPFTFDITDALGAGAQHELVVAVRDPSDAGPQPRGKQVLKPNGIWYTPCSGIWQTVWLEPVAATAITDVQVDGDPVTGVATVRVQVDGRAVERCAWRATVDGQRAACGPLACDTTGRVEVENPIAWRPGQPQLYSLRVELVQREHPNEIVDQVTTRFALRNIAVGKDKAGVTRVLLDGEALFQFGPLDQGFWPDGGYTPPTFAALKSDLDAIQAMGCNMLRKHVKVESELFYAECDRRGILVWQDMPSGDTQKDPQGFERELRAMIAARARHPSIVMWVVFNEGWGQHDTERYVELVRKLDPTRLVSNASGWTDRRCGDLIDLHQYPGPGMLPAEATRASVLGEFGGLGLPLQGHTWVEKDNWGYVSFPDRDKLTDAYVGLLQGLRPLIAEGLSAAVYTQTTDVEVEVNGWLTYDRAIQKVDATRAAAAAQALYAPIGRVVQVVPDARTERRAWRHLENAPPAEWTRADFDDSSWPTGPAGFGTEGTPGTRIGTPWTTGDIWLRGSFELDPANLHEPQWSLHHDEDVEIWLNGTRVHQAGGYTVGYVLQPMDDAARAALRKGSNVICVHCHQTRGGQYVDVGIADFQ
ncbi:MAG: glycoside hydrolase family 2 TIM barrel-domain containing protein [Planctomycetota bacterium]